MEETMATKEAYQKNLFFISAVYNWTAGILFIGLYYLNQELLKWFFKIPDGMMWYFFTSAVILIYGVGYYYISKDVQRNRDIIKLGCVGKLVFFGLCYVYWRKGDVTGLTFSLACGDFVFAMLFAQVLFTLENK